MEVENDDRAFWYYLLAHHTRDKLDRTLSLKMLQRDIRLCARCTGQLTGACIALLGTLFFAPSKAVDFIVLWLLFPLPLAIDWLTQSLGYRESNNPLRIITGAFSGFTAAITVLFLWSGLTLGFLVLFFGFLAYAAIDLGATLTLRKNLP